MWKKGLLGVIPAFCWYLGLQMATSAIGLFSLSNSQAYWDLYWIASVFGYICEAAVAWQLASRVCESVKNEMNCVMRTTGLICAVLCFSIGVVSARKISFSMVNEPANYFLQIDLAFDEARVLAMSAILTLTCVFRLSARSIPFKLSLYLSIFSATSLAARAVQEFAATLSDSRLIFMIADLAPLILWCILITAFGFEVLAIYATPPREGFGRTASGEILETLERH